MSFRKYVKKKNTKNLKGDVSKFGSGKNNHNLFLENPTKDVLFY